MPAYRCSNCKQQMSKENLFVKTVSFHRVDNARSTVRKRVVAWLCSSCMDKDDQFNTPEYSSPGHTSEAKIRADAVRNATLKKINEGGF